MEKNMEGGPNFVDPPEKAEKMAYAEEKQRQIDARRERAGLPANPEKRDEVAEEAGEQWDKMEERAKELMEENVDAIENFLEDKKSTDLGLNIYLYDNPSAFEKLKAYVGVEGSGDDSGEYETDDPDVFLQANENVVRLIRRRK